MMRYSTRIASATLSAHAFPELNLIPVYNVPFIVLYLFYRSSEHGRGEENPTRRLVPVTKWNEVPATGQENNKGIQ